MDSATWELITGDCLERMREMPDASVDAIVTDPPYGLSRPPVVRDVLQHWLAGDTYEHRGSGFMGKSWDSFVPGPQVWAEALRVLKPGGHLLAFFGARTVDLGGTALRLGGFEIRDAVAWLYGDAMPKGIRLAGDHAGWSTALKPAFEPILLARTPLLSTVAATAAEHGTGALNIDGCRIGLNAAEREIQTLRGLQGSGRWPANVVLDPPAAALLDAQVRDGDHPSRFFYHAKPVTREREHGLEGLAANTRIKARTPGQKWCRRCGRKEHAPGTSACSCDDPQWVTDREKTPRRNGHPTVKPISLMQWLVRLITPPGGLVLDPFAGSGTTGIAALREGMSFVGIEREPEYVEIARARIIGDAPLLNGAAEVVSDVR